MGTGPGFWQTHDGDTMDFEHGTTTEIEQHVARFGRPADAAVLEVLNRGSASTLWSLETVTVGRDEAACNATHRR